MSSAVRWFVALSPAVLTAAWCALLPSASDRWSTVLLLAGVILVPLSSLVAGWCTREASLVGVGATTIILVALGWWAMVDATSEPGHHGDGLEAIGIVLAAAFGGACLVAAVVGMAARAVITRPRPEIVAHHL